MNRQRALARGAEDGQIAREAAGPGRVVGLMVDYEDGAAVEAAFARARIDLLVNNATDLFIPKPGKFWEQESPSESYDRLNNVGQRTADAWSIPAL